MAFINITGWMGQALISSAEVSTGSVFLSLMMIMIALIMVAFMFHIPMEWAAIFFIPLNIGLMAQYQQFMAPGGALLIFLALLLVKNLPWK